MELELEVVVVALGCLTVALFGESRQKDETQGVTAQWVTPTQIQGG